MVAEVASVAGRLAAGRQGLLAVAEEVRMLHGHGEAGTAGCADETGTGGGERRGGGRDGGGERRGGGRDRGGRRRREL